MRTGPGVQLSRAYTIGSAMTEVGLSIDRPALPMMWAKQDRLAQREAGNGSLGLPVMRSSSLNANDNSPVTANLALAA